VLEIGIHGQVHVFIFDILVSATRSIDLYQEIKDAATEYVEGLLPNSLLPKPSQPTISSLKIVVVWWTKSGSTVEVTTA